ncbi:hypothetical protein PHG31p166 [Aeromonas phage 31]|uniref:Uncharacterized protein n=3 Tax=Biquartavirus 44RR2 TaxID=115987 RepID=Q6U9D4_9CAUD|nr:metal-dependent phosphohydrolase [Aeromonas phage 44RR2.8t]YP_238895.1 metal-dependent phosphohydrolase [Aeromonas phage 31]APU00640.1 guanosine-3',5'-bis(Diphosphate) 3'-pyrophosphohydrolase [Aeromonas phage 44RR2.8t.2]APU01060.1 guanosine-3',5'-bis(Diphosphate) 3'-pyrophosphohydrolase [Aeromonas phage 31.2]AAQ81486.1 hypothetical protein 44RRORF168c [Aeromonas phage 44RR2.8t]AAX63655.1 hypothetical protein PHG31p166 [Aeromonas phage 31]
MKYTQQHLAEAIQYATNRHAGQFDKGGAPYILHPLQLMHWARRDREALDVQILCVLHDVVEDCYDDREEGLRDINTLFGSSMAQLVDNVTKRDGESYECYLIRVNSDIRSVKCKRYDLRNNADLRRLKGVTPKDTERAVKYMTAYYNMGEKWGLK